MVSTSVISKTTRNIVNKGKKAPEFTRQEVRKEIWRPISRVKIESSILDKKAN